MINRSFENEPRVVPSYVARRISWRTGLLLAVVMGVLVGIIATWFIVSRRPKPVGNPFSASTMASVKYPLYYPTKLPAGFQLNTGSVQEPQVGVVVFDSTGPNGEKLYFSEEARPSSFNLGGFYKSLRDAQQTPVFEGVIAVGRNNDGSQEIGSRAIDQTWVLTNTTSKLPYIQLMAILESLTFSR